MNKLPIVSIIMPTYNRADLLPRAIDSVLRQSYQDWELIVVNDASTDGTKDVLERYAKRDGRIMPVNNEKNEYRQFGIANTLNKAFKMARGRYIARLDDDDYWMDEGKLAKQVAVLGKKLADGDVPLLGRHRLRRGPALAGAAFRGEMAIRVAIGMTIRFAIGMAICRRTF